MLVRIIRKVMVLVVLVVSAGTMVGYGQEGRHNSVNGEVGDSVVLQALDKRLGEYFEAMKGEGPEVQKTECDFLIGTCTDSLIRQHVALTAYEHYRDSRIMGSEAVAIHIFDKWFATGDVRMRDDMEMLAANVFAEFNRQSLIGAKAPSLQVTDIKGEPLTLYADSSSGRYSILYFYDTSCATCKLQTLLLTGLLDEEDFPVDLFAFYASDSHDAWDEYVADRFSGSYGNARIHHLWDPHMDSDFQRKYGVLQTPRMFLISPDGTILGRGLDVQALSQMLHVVFDERDLEYGRDSSMELFDSIFSDEDPSKEEVMHIADYIASATEEKGDPVMFRQMIGDMMYYLALQRSEGFKEGMDYLIDNYILSRGDVWKSSDDSLKVIGMAQMYDELLSKSTPGKTVPDMKLPGVRMTSRKYKSGEFRLKRLGGERNLIMFVTDGCNVCVARKEAAEALVQGDKKVRVLLVNVDEILLSSPALASRLFDSFDLSVLPFIMETDRKGKIVRRYISL